MDLKAIDAIAREAMWDRVEHDGREPGWLYSHGHRVGKLAVWLAEELGLTADPDLLYVAGLFHDIGKGEPDHGKVGAKQTVKLLKRWCSDDELDELAGMIASHNQRGEDGFSTAARVLQDADLLDHVGPIGSLLSLYWNGHHAERFRELVAYVRSDVNQAARDEMRTSLNFEPAKRAFDRRIQFEDDLVAAFLDVYENGTWCGDLPMLTQALHWLSQLFSPAPGAGEDG